MLVNFLCRQCEEQILFLQGRDVNEMEVFVSVGFVYLPIGYLIDYHWGDGFLVGVLGKKKKKKQDNDENNEIFF